MSILTFVIQNLVIYTIFLLDFFIFILRLSKFLFHSFYTTVRVLCCNLINFVSTSTFFTNLNSFRTYFIMFFLFKSFDLHPTSMRAKPATILTSFLVLYSIHIFETFAFKIATLNRTPEALFHQLSFKNSMHVCIYGLLTFEWTFLIIFGPSVYTISAENCPTLCAFPRFHDNFHTYETFQMFVRVFVVSYHISRTQFLYVDIVEN